MRASGSLQPACPPLAYPCSAAVESLKKERPYNMPQFMESWKQKARELKVEVYALYLAYKDPRVPLAARIFAACVVGYAFSPIDLIPDPIPILGYLDDLVLIPLGVMLARKMIPPDVLAECRTQAREVMKRGKPVNWAAAAVIIVIWVSLALMAIRLFKQFIGG